jgi:hypothetical protein
MHISSFCIKCSLSGRFASKRINMFPYVEYEFVSEMCHGLHNLSSYHPRVSHNLCTHIIY